MTAPLSLEEPIEPAGVRRFWRVVLQPGWLAVFVGIAAMATGVTTYLAISGRAPFVSTDPDIILGLLLLCFVLGLILAVLVTWRVANVIVARRSHSAGARLHSQMVIMFSLIAGVPMILVAVFSAVALYLVTEAWFGPKVQAALSSAVKVADVYVSGHKQTIRRDMVTLVQSLGNVDARTRADRPRFAEIISRQAAVLGLSAVYLLDETGQPYLRLALRRGIQMNLPDAEFLADIDTDEIVVLTDAETDQVRAVAKIPWMPGAVLFIGRTVHPDVINYQRETRDAVADYNRLEGDRFNLQVSFVLIYFVVALILILIAMLLGLTVANQIAQPIGRLIGASERISRGDLSARVDVGRTRDEIEVLGRAFNRMTGQLQSQRNELIETNREFDERRRFTEAVLSGVSAGVIGVDGSGIVTVANRSALRLLRLDSGGLVGQPLIKSVTEFAELLTTASAGGRAQAQIDMTRGEEELRLNVRITSELTTGGQAKLIITFDDITELAAAQRTAAWADVARRIAHEIKNPLTPIQLSAERLRRKYKKEISTDPEIFDQCTDTIVRHVSDIGRMVDEFSAFARMPKPIFHETDLRDLLRQAAFSQKVSLPGMELQVDAPESAVLVPCDGRLLAQVFINVLKNAGEAIAARQESEGENARAGQIRVTLREEENRALIEICDNGCGWPRALKSRLTEPYITTRKKGTGLGLAIVKKVVEDHGGRLVLADCLADGTISETTDEGGPEIVGAALRMWLPLKRTDTNRPSSGAHNDTRSENSALVGAAAGT